MELDLLTRQDSKVETVIAPLRGNDSFTGRPDDQKSLAWESLFPKGGGYFTHPTIAPQESVFSVFHQLHCVVRCDQVDLTSHSLNVVTLDHPTILNASQEHIWRHWWAFYDPAEDSVSPGVDRRSHLHHADVAEHGHQHDPGQILDPKHMTHCIELIRNVIMCKPDLTIEVKREDIGGVTGFDTEHVCKEWNGLLEWTSKWES